MRAVVVFSLLVFLASGAEADQFTPGNLLVTSWYKQLREFTREGELIQTLAIPCGVDPCPIGHQVRDVVVDAHGRAHVLNGTSAPWLSSYDPATDSWSHRTLPGWNLINNTTYGGIAMLGDLVFVPDHAIGSDPAGIIRFDLETGSALRFAEQVAGRAPIFTDLAIGPDGLLYALDGRSGGRVVVYDPFSLEQLGTLLSTSETLRTIALDRFGMVYLGTDREDLLVYDASGVLLERVPLIFTMSDIDIAVDGSFAVTSQFFEVILLLDADLMEIGSLALPAPSRWTFAAHVPTTLEIDIDVRPGDPTHSIRLAKHAVVPVAILGSEQLDVSRVVTTSLAFGPDGAPPKRPKAPRVQDVDRDGNPDLVLLFSVSEAGIQLGDTEACLDGTLLDGTRIEGCDPIQVVGACGEGFEAALVLPPVLWTARRRRAAGLTSAPPPPDLRSCT